MTHYSGRVAATSGRASGMAARLEVEILGLSGFPNAILGPFGVLRG